LSFEEMLGRNAFPDEPLDSRDRLLIQTVYAEGSKGISFNKLVEKSRTFASRSTVAVRVERLARLGYLERIGSKGPGREKPVRVTAKCFSFMFGLEKARESGCRMLSELRRIRESQPDTRERSRPEADALKKWYDGFRERYNGLFGMVGTMAIFYGTSAAGDMFLPLIVEDYKLLFAEFMRSMRSRPEFRAAIRDVIGQRLESEGTSLEEITMEAKSRFAEWGRKEATTRST
jgi:DNA-binding Lrp family transcriptional regulator